MKYYRLMLSEKDVKVHWKGVQYSEIFIFIQTVYFLIYTKSNSCPMDEDVVCNVGLWCNVGFEDNRVLEVTLIAKF